MVLRAGPTRALPLRQVPGRRYDAIAPSDPDDLRWIVENSELEEGIKHSARHWLNKLST
jgi:hypothetical protein